MAPPTPKRSVAGTIVTAIPALFLAFDVGIKLADIPPVRESFARLGYPEASGPALGLLEGLCLAAYLAPWTSVLGAILLTGYLGGAVASHLRVGDPLLTHTLFPVYVGALLWGGIFLREERLRALVPLRRS